MSEAWRTLTMIHFLLVSSVILSQTSIAVAQGNPSTPALPAVVALFEDGADDLLKLLVNPGDGAGKGEAETKNVFSGADCLRITQYQRFERRLPGWNHAIRQKPGPGEYRYLRFAWKADGANGLMLQLHDQTDWHIRYTAGANPYGWATRFVAEKAPTAWTLVTIDLFKDFGERNLTGIAFTIAGGAGCFDHVYLGRTIEDLDRIDATGLASRKPALDQQDLERLWRELNDADAAKEYWALWTLVAGGSRSRAFLTARLAPAQAADAEARQIVEWIKKLDSENFTTRERAAAELKKRLEAAAPHLEAELTRMPSAEVRRRINALLVGMPNREQELARRNKAERVLRYIAEREAKERRH